VLTVPAGTAALTGVVNATTDALNLYGFNYGPPDPTSSSKYDCSATSGEDIGNGLFQYKLDCQLPRSGLFVFMWFHDAVTPVALYNASLLLNVQTCAGNTGGFNCSETSSVFNSTTDNGTPIIVPGGAFRYFYYDFANDSNGYWTITVSGNTTGTMYIRRGGYPDTSNYENSDQYVSFSSTSNGTKYITAEDTFIGGRWYVAIENTDSNDLAGSYRLFTDLVSSVTPTQQTSRTQSPTTPTPTDDESSSPAALLMPSVLFALFAFLSTLF